LREAREKARRLLANDPLLVTIEGPLRGYVRDGFKNRVVYDKQILERRGIMTRRYDLPRKMRRTLFGVFASPNTRYERRLPKELARILSTELIGGWFYRRSSSSVHRDLSRHRSILKRSRTTANYELSKLANRQRRDAKITVYVETELFRAVAVRAIAHRAAKIYLTRLIQICDGLRLTENRSQLTASERRNGYIAGGIDQKFFRFGFGFTTWPAVYQPKLLE